MTPPIKGLLEIQDSAGTVTRITLDGDTAAISAGGHGQVGDLVLKNINDAPIITLDASTGIKVNGTTGVHVYDGSVMASESDDEIGVFGKGYDGVVGFGFREKISLDWIDKFGLPSGVVGSCDSEIGIGVFGSSAHGFGVWGTCDDNLAGVSSLSAYAGYFEGNVEITQDFSVGGVKQFKIDHPLDPANKYLLHASVESAEMLNVYSGNAVLDANGEAWIDLPAWFEALNTDFRYQLTAIGGPTPNLHVAQEISNNRFQIAGGRAGMKVSWQVTGVRQDAYAKAHPMQVEVEKREGERGAYLHPIELGLPSEARIGYDRARKQLERAALLRRESPDKR